MHGNVQMTVSGFSSGRTKKTYQGELLTYAKYLINSGTSVAS